MKYFLEDLNYYWKIIVMWFIIIVVLLYSLIGTSGNVEQIKEMAPNKIAESHWKVLAYEGYQYGSWSNHGGKVWYQVEDISNPNIRYRVYYTLWNGELQATFGAPEVITNLQINNNQ